ncbi:hypothetical protein OESDEN_02146 [Oesophagostomum dentatum]|uniref:Vacuolar protein sorting-associated protein 8 central domain-containing protein n=1 Tax=Oesophagostomum dentatum TaxID=61180 RepID=A0A0B1TKT1_OESDE|nr:hypothetical protein OESDEN_02146 [Oesophagostomum dentatum]
MNSVASSTDAEDWLDVSDTLSLPSLSLDDVLNEVSHLDDEPFCGGLSEDAGITPSPVPIPANYKVDSAVKINRLGRVEGDVMSRSIFLESLDEFILDGTLEMPPPALVSEYLSHLASEGHFSQLQASVVRFPIECIDIHYVMSTCKQNNLYDGIIYVMNKAFNDYLSPLEEMLSDVSSFASHEVYSDSEVERGNRLLLYLHCCLAGHAYPYGSLPSTQLKAVPEEAYRCIISLRGKDGTSTTANYPYLRLLLLFDAQQAVYALMRMDWHQSSAESAVVETLRTTPQIDKHSILRMALSPFRGIVKQKPENLDSILQDLLVYWLPTGSRTDFCLNLAAAAECENSMILLMEARGLLDNAFEVLSKQIDKSKGNQQRFVYWLDKGLSFCSSHSSFSHSRGWLLRIMRIVTTAVAEENSVDVEFRLRSLANGILENGSEHSLELVECLLDYPSFKHGLFRDYATLIYKILGTCSYETFVTKQLLLCIDQESAEDLLFQRNQLCRRVGGLVSPQCIACQGGVTKAAYIFGCGHLVHMECDRGERQCPCLLSNTKNLKQDSSIATVLRPQKRLLHETRDIFGKWDNTLLLTPH